jgi:hypothetical protein
LICNSKDKAGGLKNQNGVLGILPPYRQRVDISLNRGGVEMEVKR